MSLEKVNFEVEEVSKEFVYTFVQKYHYSPVFPVLTKHWLGVFLDNVMVGAITLGWGTQPKGTIRKMFPNHEFETTDYYEIGKMCMSDTLPKNSESQMIKSVVNWLKTNDRNLNKGQDRRLFLYTMADGIMGKVGYVYQASNLYYGGKYWTDVYMSETGEKIHPRTAKKLCEENAEFVGKSKVFWLTPDFLKEKKMKRVRGRMFRYIFPLTKKAENILLEYGWNKDYPKNNDLEWQIQSWEKNSRGICTWSSVVEKPKFCYDDIKHNKKNVEKYNRINYDDVDWNRENLIKGLGRFLK